MRVMVLGAGRVGSAIVADLVKENDWGISVADISITALERLGVAPNLDKQVADLGDPAVVGRIVPGHDLVVGAVPGPMGFATMRAVIEAGVNVVDISFFEEDPFDLDDLARKRGVTALMDCGIAPGCSNLIIGHLQTVFDGIDAFSCYVGGLPSVRHWPFEYRAVFSPIDVLAEYTRPARLVEHGRVVTRVALSEVELLDFPGVGTLEAFNTDGLRTLLRTVDVPHMKEKTMRYPGHADSMRMLRETGFFATDPVRVGENMVRPIDLTAELLFPAWNLREGEEDLTAMRVEVDGTFKGKRCRRIYDLLDRFDRATGTTSMARTTGYTCTAVVRALAAGLYTEPGVSPPEFLGRASGCYDFVIERLRERGVIFEEREEGGGEW